MARVSKPKPTAPAPPSTEGTSNGPLAQWSPLSQQSTALLRQAVPMVMVNSTTGQAQAAPITDGESFERAAAFVKLTGAFIERVEAATTPVISAAHAAWQAALKQKREFLGPVERVRAALRDRMGEFEHAQAKIRREAELAAQRERERLEAEERARVRAEEERRRREAEAQRVEQVAAAQAVGDVRLAQHLQEAPVQVEPVAPRPVFVPPPQVAPPPRVEGLSFRSDWSAQVTSLMDLVKAVAAGTVSPACVKADEVVLNKMAKALKDQLNIPGVKAVESRVPVQQ